MVALNHFDNFFRMLVLQPDVRFWVHFQEQLNLLIACSGRQLLQQGPDLRRVFVAEHLGKDFDLLGFVTNASPSSTAVSPSPSRASA